MIFHVQSKLNHNGTIYEKGSFIISEENFSELCREGVLKQIDAETVAEAEAIVNAEADTAKAEANEEVKPQDTWGPRPADSIENQPLTPEEKQEEVKTEEAKTEQAPALAKYRVLKEFEIKNPESKNFGVHTVGAEIEADPSAAQALVEDGVLEAIVDGDNL